MDCKDVKTQAELDAALVDDEVTCVHIKSERGVWLRVTDNKSRSVEASGSASVVASGSASVVAYGSASVVAYGSASVVAYGSASVVAYGSASVVAYDSASVVAYDSASVEASGSASVHAHMASRVKATPHVAVHLHSGEATVEGGVLIDLTALDLHDPAVWAEHHGVAVSVEDGTALLYKALDDELMAGQDHGRPTVYALGETVACDDWRADNDCGGGLHLSPTPHQAKRYRTSATRFVEVAVALADLRPILDSTPKCKVASCRVLREVDIHMRPVVRESEPATP